MTNQYASAYNESGFWNTLITYIKKIGRETAVMALTLFYALEDPNVPVWAKGVITGALGYLISPVDLVPDFLPGGFVDDAAALAAALTAVAAHVSPEVRARARARAAEWFA